MTFYLDLWPSDLKINRDHLLTKDYLPTKFEASGAKRSWVISCTRLRDTDIPTDRHTDRQVQSNMPSFFKGGHKYDPKLNFDLGLGSQFSVEFWPGVMIQRGILTRGHNSTWNSDPSTYFLPVELPLKKVSKFNRVIKIQRKIHWIFTPGRYSIGGSKFYLTPTNNAIFLI